MLKRLKKHSIKGTEGRAPYYEILSGIYKTTEEITLEILPLSLE